MKQPEYRSNYFNIVETVEGSYFNLCSFMRSGFNASKDILICKVLVQCRASEGIIYKFRELVGNSDF